ncbi:hypothetical protein [Rhizobium redzepovicii]|uniref:hypothetical protein n=1 Tax=Rhizobium redzepovicii TaxID=2867518 RepID=UPI001C933EE2|nr:hypothetical protein [Rhizobium redzepovicii]MBY4615711.1 hypothetical protein [Rhizobium redzepovicii]
MASSYAEWKLRTSEIDAAIAQIGASLLRIRELEGVAELEGKLLLNPPRNGKASPQLAEHIDRLSTKLFGITEEDTHFKYPDNFESLIEGMPEWWRAQSRANEFEDRFSTGQMTDDEAVLALLVLGVDFRDERGDPLRCTKFLSRQVEGAVFNVMGHLPDFEELGLKTWESRLQKEANLHLSRKGRR